MNFNNTIVRQRDDGWIAYYVDNESNVFEAFAYTREAVVNVLLGRIAEGTPSVEAAQ